MMRKKFQTQLAMLKAERTVSNQLAMNETAGTVRLQSRFGAASAKRAAWTLVIGTAIRLEVS